MDENLGSGQLPGNLMSKLRTEKEIISSWKSTKNDPVISICCITFNHEAYIEEAIHGFLIQETDFPLEILIHDDASSDLTASIIRRYQRAYPSIIKAVFQNENQYSQGIKAITFLSPLVRGKYVALCEGDDYWISKKKLSTQLKSMIDNSVGFSFHKAYQVDFSSSKCIEIGAYQKKNSLIPRKEIIMQSSGVIPTASILVDASLFRRHACFMTLAPWLDCGDIYLQFFGSQKNGAMFINETMSVYRKYTPGSWTLRQLQDPTFNIKHTAVKIKSYELLDILTLHEFQPLIKKKNRKTLTDLLESEIKYSERLRTYLWGLRKLGVRTSLLYLVVVLFPFMGLYRDLKEYACTIWKKLGNSAP